MNRSDYDEIAPGVVGIRKREDEAQAEFQERIDRAMDSSAGSPGSPEWIKQKVEQVGQLLATGVMTHDEAKRYLEENVKPVGVDPSNEEWKELVKPMSKGKPPKQSLRLKRIVVHPAILQHFFVEDKRGVFVKEGLPNDSKFEGWNIDAATMCLNVIYSHPSWDEVPEAQVIPQFNPVFIPGDHEDSPFMKELKTL
jgi:hypothetical protein